MIFFEEDQTGAGRKKLVKTIDIVAFGLATGGFLVLLGGVFQFSVSYILVGAMALVIGLFGGAVSAILYLAGRRSG